VVSHDLPDNDIGNLVVLVPKQVPMPLICGQAIVGARASASFGR
jgi:hypothetical protein